jgi:hypothetical protein
MEYEVLADPFDIATSGDGMLCACTWRVAFELGTCFLPFQQSLLNVIGALHGDGMRESSGL